MKNLGDIVNTYEPLDRPPIKLICANCGVINDDKAHIWVCKDSDDLCVMTNGETKCWYCNMWFHWELEKKTTDKIFENEKKRKKCY